MCASSAVDQDTKCEIYNRFEGLFELLNYVIPKNIDKVFC